MKTDESLMTISLNTAKKLEELRELAERMLRVMDYYAWIAEKPGEIAHALDILKEKEKVDKYLAEAGEILEKYRNIELTGFKVLKRNKFGALISCHVPPEQGGCIYSVGKIVYPDEGCGPLSVFATIRAAAFYSYRIEGTTVWSCKFKPSPINRVWTKQLPTCLYDCLPCETALADWVMITEEVSPDLIARIMENQFKIDAR